jgi:transcriptional regulator with XRE-family HTH domain
LPKSVSTTFKRRLLELRQTLRWTQKRAAEAGKINPCLYQLYELGIKTNPGLLTLEKIANGFGIEVHELLTPAFVLRPRVNKPAIHPKGKSSSQRKRRNQKKK